MGVMEIPMRALLATTLVLLCESMVVSAFDGYNGLPRPAGMDQDPTTTYGPKPAVEYENKPAKCIWYGWENGNYPPEGTQNCSNSLWASLSAANPAGLSGFMYYVPLDNAYFDPLYNEYLCAIGCFDLTAAPGPAARPASPPNADPPADVPPAAFPPADAAPPPAETTAPPSDGVLVPPPATLFRPPPPAPPLPPSPLPPSPTPSLIVEPPIESPPLPSISVPVSGPVLSPETSPEISPETSPLSSPGSSPIYNPITGPGPTSGGPLNVIQGGSATTTSAPKVLALSAALFLCINFLV